jgi:hypothetical protein
MTEQHEQSTTAILEARKQPQTQTFTPVSVDTVEDADILNCLRRNFKLAEITALARKDAVVLANCEKLGITVSDEEWQIAGDEFRTEHQLWGIPQTMAWLEQQQITVDEWSQAIKVSLLEKKLKEHLCGATVDSTYISNRDNYRRVALSQILVVDLATANKVVKMLREETASFCAVALEYSKGKLSHENGGFLGVRYMVELVPEVATAISNAEVGEIIGPVESKLGYHILKVDKWFPTELNQAVREQVMEALFKIWLQNLHNSSNNTKQDK